MYGEPSYRLGGVAYQFINFLRVLEGQKPNYIGSESGDHVKLLASRVINKHLDYLNDLYKNYETDSKQL